jgi:long-chain fatty acid transport protein
MQKRFNLHLAITSVCFSSLAFGSDFSLPFVNSSGLGVAYADWATAANDASTSYTNPAGLVKLPHQQVVFNALGITGTAQFTGTSVTPPYPFPLAITQTGVARSKINAFSPSFYYAAPINDRFSFGFNVTAPFGLGTNYGSSRIGSIARYAATRSEVLGIDAGPTVGVKLSERIAVGAGFDVMHLGFTLNNMYGPPVSLPFDARLQNHLHGWGYGWHAGTLFDLTPKTRLGFSYNSLIAIHTKGHSTVYSLIAPPLRTNQQRTNASLPARAQLSLQHDITDRWTGMATAFYTNWKTFNQIIMKNTMLPNGQTVSVTIPFNYHNCFDYSVGAAFKANEKLLLRGGIEFMNTPSNDRDRGIADPIGSATILTVGTHFQASESVGFDLGVGHSFFKQMPINLTNALTRLQGHTNAQTTVIGGQINWSIA